MATPAELGLVTPDGQDWTRDGDNAITTNANVLAQIFTEQELENEKFANSLQYKVTPPAGSILDWYGTSYAGIYRFPTPDAVAAVPGLMPGTKPGQAIVLPVGSTTSTIFWVEFGDGGRHLEITVSSVPANRTGWIIRTQTKRVGTSLSLTGGAGTTVRTDVAWRLPVSYGVDIPAWLIHVRNYDLRDSNGYAGNLDIAVSIGEAEIDQFGEFTGNWIDGTQKIVTPSMITFGSSEVITLRMDYNFDKSKSYLVSLRARGATGQVMVNAYGGGFILDNPASVHSVVASSTQVGITPLMVWIEAIVDSNVQVEGIVGDSLAVGHSAKYPVFDSWLAKKCRAEGALPMFWAASGDTMANFSNPIVWKFHQFEKMARPNKVYFALGSNDWGGAKVTFEQFKTLFFACWNALRPFVGTNMVLCSVWPRYVLADEPVRKQINAWFKNELPGGATYYVNNAAAITAPNGDTLDPHWAANPGNIHLSSAGYALVASNFSGGSPVGKEPAELIQLTDPSIVSGTLYLVKKGDVCQLTASALKFNVTGTVTLNGVIPEHMRSTGIVWGAPNNYWSSETPNKWRITNSGSIQIQSVNESSIVNMFTTWIPNI